MATTTILSFNSELYFWLSKTHEMKFFRWLHTFYAGTLFVATFLCVFPIFFICAQKKSWHKTAYQVTHYWGITYFFLAGIKVKIENSNKADWMKPCIYVANHFSFSDIASIPLIANDACFVGKQSISKVPLFGYYFKSLHIPVNRESVRDRANVFEKSIQALRDKKSLIIFPEGGIRSSNPPQQVRYKDGAFRMAIAQQVPIVPVTLPSNWELLPDDGKLLLRGKNLNIVIHEAIDTTGLKEDDVAALRESVFEIIQNTLNEKNSIYTDAIKK
jgi:1-acyl-sn-glycerol-3-phosphate acyltransferase